MLPNAPALAQPVPSATKALLTIICPPANSYSSLKTCSEVTSSHSSPISTTPHAAPSYTDQVTLSTATGQIGQHQFQHPVLGVAWG